ncbi:MAG: hypothetical protein ACKV19_03670 [Verrucomicrobiales bacterium]
MNSSLNHCTGLLNLAKIRNLLLLPAALLAGFLQSAGGQIVYSTGFEPDTYLAGAPLVGQDGWFAPPPLSPGAAKVTSGKPRQGKQTVEVHGAELVSQDFINELTDGYYDAIGS